MRKYAQKELKELINDGYAIDITYSRDRSAIAEEYNQVGYSSGIYGCNGLLLQGLESGNLCAVAGRTRAIYIFS